MSSNEKMVMVPFGVFERWRAGALTAEDSAAIGRIADQPAEQNQGEPVSLPARHDVTADWAVPGGPFRAEGHNACLDEIAKLGPLYTRPAQGEPVAWRYQSHAGGLWYLSSSEHNAHTFKDNGEGGEVQALYTHADPAEVERMRAEVAKFRGYCVDLDSEKRELEHKMDAYKGQAEDAITLRAQLAERDALLRQCGNPVRVQISRLEDEAKRSDHPKLYRDEVERLSVILRQMDAISALERKP